MPPKKVKLTQTNAQFKEMFLRIEEYALGNMLGDTGFDAELEDYINKQIAFMQFTSRNKESKDFLRKQIMMCEDGEYFGLDNWMELWRKYKPVEPKKKIVSDDEDDSKIDDQTNKKKKKILD